jgi:hypothetical protein
MNELLFGGVAVALLAGVLMSVLAHREGTAGHQHVVMDGSTLLWSGGSLLLGSMISASLISVSDLGTQAADYLADRYDLWDGLILFIAGFVLALIGLGIWRFLASLAAGKVKFGWKGWVAIAVGLLALIAWASGNHDIFITPMSVLAVPAILILMVLALLKTIIPEKKPAGGKKKKDDDHD